MNLIDDEQQTKNNKFKGLMIGIIILIIILIVISIVLVVMIDNIKTNTLKLNVNGASVTKFSNDMFLFENGKMYIAIKDFASMVGYETFNGDKNHIEEDTTKCYIDNGSEQAEFELNTNIIHKTNTTNNEYFTIEEPVRMNNNKLYIEASGMKIGANCTIGYNSSNNQITIYTLPYVVSFYGKKYPNSIVANIGSNNNNLKPSYNNQKALLYNMVVVVNDNKKYGVINIDGTEIIGTKYDNIEFIEGSEDFIVKTDQNKMGIVTNKGTTKIEAVYDDIKEINKEPKLYLVTNNGKQGVLNDNGNTVVYLEYDKVGINTSTYPSNDIKNEYILFDKCIPVQRNNKWGLYDINGRQIVPVEYDGLGCTNVSGANNLLIIPEYEGIVVLKNKLYGLVDANGEVLIQCVLDKFYSITNAGEDTYYMEQGENQYDVIDYIRKYVLHETETNTNNNPNNNTNENNNENNNANETQTENTNTNNTQV